MSFRMRLQSKKNGPKTEPRTEPKGEPKGEPSQKLSIKEEKSITAMQSLQKKKEVIIMSTRDNLTKKEHFKLGQETVVYDEVNCFWKIKED